MDSLLASYASSDEDDEPQTQPPKPPPPSLPPSNSKSSSSSLFSSLPKPQSRPSLFSSLPPPSSSSSSITPSSSSFQQHPPSQPPSKSTLFSSLPPPKSHSQTTPDTPLPPSNPNPKRVVQFRPPVPLPPSKFHTNDDEEDEQDQEDQERNKKRQQLGHDTSVKSFLSAMPAPKNSLGSAPLCASLASGRRSIIQNEGSADPAPAPASIDDDNGVNNEAGFDNNAENVDAQVNSHTYSYEMGVAGDHSYTGYEGYSGYGSTGGYDSYGSYAQYDTGGWYDTSSSGAMPAPETSAGVESFVSIGGKRRKDQAPTEIVEVKQDELMKDRPREDKSKLTGIAFGPSYQPASTKGKPSKLHKRKHQIGALYFDMRQKEMELAERRAKGLLTKAETQAKYGW